MHEPTWRIGDVDVTRVVEQSNPRPATAILPGATPEVLARHAEWIAPWSLAGPDEIVLTIQAFAVEADGRRILVDTCAGPHALPGPWAGLLGDGGFLDALAAAGFAAETIDTVVCTHLHFDHVGWNTIRVDGRLVPAFPNARYVIAREEAEHWRAMDADARPGAAAPNFADAVEPLFEHGVVDLVESDHRISPSVALFPTPGHTPGHVSVRIGSAGAVAVITGDCAHHPVQLCEPACASGVDADPVASVATRRALIAEVVDRDVLVIGTHFPPPSAGHMVSTPDGPRFVVLA